MKPAFSKCRVPGGVVSWVKRGQKTPVAAKVFSGTLDLQTVIDQTSNLEVGKEIDLDILSSESL